MRVLLVEDDNMIGEALAAGLKDARYAADWVKNGRTALDALAAQAYDLVLLDLGLPQKDGLAVLAEIRSSSRCASSGAGIGIASTSAGSTRSGRS